MFIIYGRLAADGRDVRRDAFLARRPRWRRRRQRQGGEGDKLTRKRGGGVCMRSEPAAPVMFYYSNWRRRSKAHHSLTALTHGRALTPPLVRLGRSPSPTACSWLLTNGIRRGGIQPGTCCVGGSTPCVACCLFFFFFTVSTQVGGETAVAFHFHTPTVISHQCNATEWRCLGWRGAIPCRLFLFLAALLFYTCSSEACGSTQPIHVH